MQIPSQTELRRFFGQEQAADVQFVETVASWSSLRILDYIYTEESATTGEIARGLNMDMTEVKDRLEALESQHVVEVEEDAWCATSERIIIELQQRDGLEISYSLDSPTEADEGLFSTLKRAITSTIR